MNPERRAFLVDTSATVGSILLMPSIVGCFAYFLSPTELEKKITQLQNNAGPQKDGVGYKRLEGYVYDILVDGKPVHVNLSHNCFHRRNHSLKYTIGNTSYCVVVRDAFDHVIVESAENKKPITDPNIVKEAETLTDKVLGALASEQERLIKKRNKGENQNSHNQQQLYNRPV